jgi:poly(A) polymerase
MTAVTSNPSISLSNTFLPGNIPPEEQKPNEELIESLIQHGIFDTEEASERRKKIITRLTAMVKAWAVSIGTAKGVPEDHVLEGGGIQIQVFGSTRLEVQNHDSDMDLLCIAPYYITKSDFFTSFCDTLTTCPDIENLLSIPEAYTPVIKFIILGLSVDIIFSSIQMPKLPTPLDVLDLRCLKGLDEQGVRSLNGVRVAEWIHKLIPNMINYRITLRAVKHWAKQRGLYSNVLGFLGGVNFALLVAAVCQQFETASPFIILQKFFAIYANWPWPCPVILRRFEDLQFKNTDGNYLPVWNPVVNFKDSLHLMPIITPAYPAMNSAYNIAQPQFRCIQVLSASSFLCVFESFNFLFFFFFFFFVSQEELLRANDVFQNYTFGTTFPWSRLFESSTEEFFRKFPRYIQIDIISSTATDHRIWFGWVESRIRMLILSLEQPPTVYCHPIANCFHRQPVKQSPTTKDLANEDPSNPHGNSPSPLTATSESTDNAESTNDQYQSIPPASGIAEGSQTGIPSESNPISPDQTTFVLNHYDPATFSTPKRLSKQNLMEAVGDEFVHASSFFIGLSFGTSQSRVDVTPQIDVSILLCLFSDFS